MKGTLIWDMGEHSGTKDEGHVEPFNAETWDTALP